MELSDQVTSLEISKRLKGLGVKQESLFYWHWIAKNQYKGKWGIRQPFKDEIKDHSFTSAFTSSELGEMLPNYIKIDKQTTFLYIAKNTAKEWSVFYNNPRSDKSYDSVPANTLSDAMGKMLIYLYEHDLMDK